MGYWILVNSLGGGNYAIGTLVSDNAMGGTEKSLAVFTTWSNAHLARMEKAFEEEWEPTPLDASYQGALAANPLQCQDVAIDALSGRRFMPIPYSRFFEQLASRSPSVALQPTEGIFRVEKAISGFGAGTFLRIIDDGKEFHILDHFDAKGKPIEFQTGLCDKACIEAFISNGDIKRIGFRKSDMCR